MTNVMLPPETSAVARTRSGDTRTRASEIASLAGALASPWNVWAGDGPAVGPLQAGVASRRAGAVAARPTIVRRYSAPAPRSISYGIYNWRPWPRTSSTGSFRTRAA